MKKKVITISLIALFSIGLWVSVALSQDYIITVRAPIQFSDIPKNYSVGSPSVDEVYLQIKGKGWELAKLNLARTFEFNIPVHKRVGRYKNNLSDYIEANSWITNSFQVLGIVPNQIDYDIEKTDTKLVKIAGNFNLIFKPGYGMVSHIIVSPETIEISGPYQLLQKIDTVKTQFREFDEISDNINVEIPLEEINGITVSQKNCIVKVDVQKIVDKTFEGIEVETRAVPYSKELVLFPGKIDVVLRGGINILGKLSNDSIKVYVDYWSAVKENSGSIEPTIEIPKFTTLSNIQPQKLEYIIKQH